MTKTVSIQGQQKWEFFIEIRKTEISLLEALNQLGQEGWDLVTVLHDKDLKGAMCWTAFLRRPSTGQAPSPPAAKAAATVAVPSAGKPDAAGSQGFDLSDDDFNLAPE